MLCISTFVLSCYGFFLQGELDRPRLIPMNITVVISASAIPLIMMVLLSTIIKVSGLLLRLCTAEQAL